MNWNTLDLSLAGLREHYRRNDFSPAELIDFLLQQCAQFHHHNIWISLLSRAQVDPYLRALGERGPDTLPLYGVPFAIKDNIDLADVPTTAACQEFAYTPEDSAFVVARLLAAGAIPLGKTNLDQFATGLVGTRSPWGVCKNAVNPDYISGGSSSGSAVAVALGLVSFSLGTDTAGSGRIPAAMNGIVGLKSTRGLLSTRGVVPACRSLDTVSIFARSVDDTASLRTLCAEFDPEERYSRDKPDYFNVKNKPQGKQYPTLGVPQTSQLQFFGDAGCARAFDVALARWRALGADIVEVDFQPFGDAARLLYEGPWVAERFIAVEPLWQQNPDEIDPVVRTVIENASRYSAVDTFKALYTLQQCKHQADREMAKVDALLTPTAAAQYRIQQVMDEPFALNANLGYYTNYMNLLDYAAIALPAGVTDKQIPFGITLAVDKFAEQTLFALGRHWETHADVVCSSPNPKKPA